MSGETSLAKLLATMNPQQRPGRFVFVTVNDSPTEAEVLASVVEAEGLSVVVAQDDADRLGLVYDYIAGWITLEVHSSLAAVGLTAAVSTALAEATISCNVVAGRHHDHLLVPIERVDAAIDVLEALICSGIEDGIAVQVGDPTGTVRRTQAHSDASPTHARPRERP